MEIEYAIFFHLAKSCPWAVPGLNFSFYHLCLIRPSHLPSILSRKLPSKLISTFTNKYNGNTGKNLGRDELGLSGASRSPLPLFYYQIHSLFFQGLEKLPPSTERLTLWATRPQPQTSVVAHGGRRDPGPETASFLRPPVNACASASSWLSALRTHFSSHAPRAIPLNPHTMFPLALIPLKVQTRCKPPPPLMWAGSVYTSTRVNKRQTDRH